MYKKIENWLDKLGDRVLFRGELKEIVEYSGSFKLLRGTPYSKFMLKRKIKKEIDELLKVLNRSYDLNYSMKKKNDWYLKTFGYQLDVTDCNGLTYSNPVGRDYKINEQEFYPKVGKFQMFAALDRCKENFTNPRQLMNIYKIKIKYDGVDRHGMILDIENNLFDKPLITWKPTQSYQYGFAFEPIYVGNTVAEGVLVEVLKKEWKPYLFKPLSDSSYLYIIRQCELIKYDKKPSEILEDLKTEDDKQKEKGLNYKPKKSVEEFKDVNLNSLINVISNIVKATETDDLNAVLVYRSFKKAIGETSVFT